MDPPCYFGCPLLLYFFGPGWGVNSVLLYAGCNIKIQLKAHKNPTILTPRKPKISTKSREGHGPFQAPLVVLYAYPLVPSATRLLCSFTPTRTLYVVSSLLTASNDCEASADRIIRESRSAHTSATSSKTLIGIEK